MTDELERLKHEGQILRSLLPKLGAPCVYCGQTNIGKCERGFPGCSQADDIMCGDDEWVREQQATIRRLEAEIAELRGVLLRGGFVQCDIAACNCGSWHARYGLPERMRELKDALADAGHPLCNENGHLVSGALAELIAERDRLIDDRTS